jgi:hypothetical protein
LNRSARQFVWVVCAALVVCSGSGCRWNSWFRRNASEPPPIAFSALPSREEAVAAVNANSGRIQSLATQGATVSVPGAPAIGAEIALERPKRLRFRAGTNLLGPELDLGSNDLLFWFWAARSPDQSVFYARHDQFAASRARQMLAIEPTWLIDALGVVEIDPASIVEDPAAASGDRVVVKTTLSAAAGTFTRHIHLHNKFGWVLEQHLYDDRGQIVASARNSRHEYYPLDGVSLPKRVEVHMPQGQLQLQLDIDRWAINQPPAEGQALFELPREQHSGRAFVDLADPNFVPPGGTLPVGEPQPRLSQAPQTAVQDRYRGFTQWR